ncbi:MAG: YdeI/OmpD-associated family protein [Labilithrix sp.]|nr:YdeI/OmpD-associated family protein [Labilithrix sp.]
MNPKVDAFLKQQGNWRAELTQLREILLGTGLTEELKWGHPCYALDGKNVVLIHGFKEYCAILFHKGALLEDAKGVLIQQTRNVQSARQIRFTSVQEVNKLKSTVKAYVREAIAIEHAGLKVQFKKTEDFERPEELESKLAANAKLRAAFSALTPGRQRAYIFHFSQAKLPKTRAARVAKHIPRILKGLGLDD